MPFFFQPMGTKHRSPKALCRRVQKWKRVKLSVTQSKTSPTVDNSSLGNVPENESFNNTVPVAENILHDETARLITNDNDDVDSSMDDESASDIVPVSNIDAVDTSTDEDSLVDDLPCHNKHSQDEGDAFKIGHKIKSIFRRWGIKHKVTRQAGTDLLEILRDEEVRSNLKVLPRCWRAVRRIPKQFQKFNPNICQKAGGEYAYLGIEKNLKCGNNFFFNPSDDTISLSINVDGVPLTESSKSTFYPLLGKCENANVFMIALWHSQNKSKPIDHNEFLMDFVEESKYLEKNGIVLNGKHYHFEIKNVICDSIAKAPLLNIKGPTGFFSCPKCTVRGRKLRRIIPGTKRKRNGGEKTQSSNTHFLDLDAPSRKHEDFLTLSSGVEDDTFYHGYTILRELTSLDLVRDIVVDSMHKVYLGAGKRLLDALLDGYVDFSGSSQRRKPVVRGSDKERISCHLDYLRTEQFCPTEFARKPRNLDVRSFWKTTEFRQFILYTGASILKSYLPEDHFELFTIFVIAIRMLSTYEGLDVMRIEYAGGLIDSFIRKCAKLFGDTFVVHVVHMLHHLPEDVKMFGILQVFSAFPFEDFNFVLTQNVKSGNKPLEQMLRSYEEMVESGMFNKKDFETTGIEMCAQNRITVGSLLFRSDREGDQYCSIEKNGFCIVKIKSFAQRNGSIFITGQPFRKLKSLFKGPCDSKEVNIYKCQNQFNSLIEFPAADVTGKFYPIPHSEEKKKFTMVKMLHH